MSQALQEHRRRLSERGMKRVEVCVREPDVSLIRRVAKALINDDKAAKGLRSAIESVVPNRQPLTFKEWLLASPADGDEASAREKPRGF
jgi:hypothetical protein